LSTLDGPVGQAGRCPEILTSGSLFPFISEASPNDDHRGFRNFIVLPAQTHSGHPVFFHVLGEISGDAFTDDSAGDEAFEIAEDAALYLFPSAGVDPLTTDLPFPFRQSDLMDLRGGYFSNNPLGLWVLIFPIYTEDAIDQMDTHPLLLEMAEENGLDTDGTPLIRTRGDLRELHREGLLDLVKRPVHGGLPRYSICPTYKDPRDGVIRPGDILFESAAQPELGEAFESLQSTGDWP